MNTEAPNLDEKQAINSLKQGDLNGLDVLVSLYQVRAVHAAYLIIHDRGLAEDAVQTAFLRAVERINQFDDHRPFKSWFLRCVVNATLDACKQQNRWVSLEDGKPGDASHDLAPKWINSSPDLDDMVEAELNRRLVRKALTELTAEQRTVIVMRFYLEMDETEMAKTLHRPLSTVKWRLYTARQRLKSLLLPVWRSRTEENPENILDGK